MDTTDQKPELLTKREYFAAMALQGILANPHVQKFDTEATSWKEKVCRSEMAVEYADIILKVLQR